MILQAYDFFKLNEKYKCILQIGGSDQWGNIVNGVELIRKISQKDSFGLTTNLITLSSGAKMGKTESGAIWLDKNLLSPYEYWQFWRNTADNDVERFLKYFTDIDSSQIEDIVKSEKNINNLKILLANETTKILHGSKAAEDSENTAKKTFEEKGIGKNLPEVLINKSILNKGLNILDLLCTNKFILSKSEARRAIKSNGIKINDKLVTDDKMLINLNNLQGNAIKVSHGKKKHFVVKIT